MYILDSVNSLPFNVWPSILWVWNKNNYIVTFYATFFFLEIFLISIWFAVIQMNQIVFQFCITIRSYSIKFFWNYYKITIYEIEFKIGDSMWTWDCSTPGCAQYWLGFCWGGKEFDEFALRTYVRMFHLSILTLSTTWFYVNSSKKKKTHTPFARLWSIENFWTRNNSIDSINLWS